VQVVLLVMVLECKGQTEATQYFQLSLLQVAAVADAPALMAPMADPVVV
jgi:hypothetical protein